MGSPNVIPEEKIREACEKCMRHARYAMYFNEAPPGARQYIALVFYETIFPDDLSDELSNQCFDEVVQELGEEDLQYLIAHEKDAHARDAFIERLAFLKEKSVLKREAESGEEAHPEREVGQTQRDGLSQIEEQPQVIRSVTQFSPVRAYRFFYDARRLDREVAVWTGRWKVVCISICLIGVLAFVEALAYLVMLGRD